MHEAKRQDRVWVVAAVAALAAVTLLRFVYLRSLPGGGFFVKYLWFADEIMAGRLHRDRLADLSPMYLWLITFLRWLGLSEWPIRFLQVSMVSGVAACAGAAAHRFGGWIAATVAALIVLANRAALVNATDFEPETLLLLFEAIGVALVVTSHRTPSRSRSALAGLMLGLAIITRPVALLTAVVLGAHLAWRSRALPWMFAVTAALPVIVILGVNTRLTGDTVIMDPGTVFYEGMNPIATGCTGSLPRIVRDLEPTINGPDTLHVAYRLVAAGATGNPRISRAESNRWWAGHALAYARRSPAQAVKLTFHKLGSALERHDYYDVTSMDILARSMIAPLWIPWSVAIALALSALLVARRESLLTFGLLAIAAALPMLIFFVTARHRNPLLIPVSVLGGLAAEGIWRRLHSGNRGRAAAALAVAAVAAALLSIDTQRARANDYFSRSFLEVRAATAAIAEASRRGDVRTAAVVQAYARTWSPEVAPIPDPRVLRGVARSELARAADPQRLFRIGIALEDAGARDDARRVLRLVDADDPQPTEKLPPPSLYLARSQARSGEFDEARRWLARASKIAPGNADVLALTAALDGDREAALSLGRLHDPFTASLASAEAQLAMCQDRNCTAAVLDDLGKLSGRFPQWTRPARVAADEVARASVASPPR